MFCFSAFAAITRLLADERKHLGALRVGSSDEAAHHADRIRRRDQPVHPFDDRLPHRIRLDAGEKQNFFFIEET
jgi:hypothetical protein